VQLGDIEAGDVVLDVGCGSGYSTAVLAQLASAVVAMEDDASLAESADQILTALEISNAAVLSGDLTKGVPSEAPFNVIVVEGLVEAIPQKLFDQLKDGGRLVACVARGRSGFATVFQKSGAEITEREAFNLNMPKIAAFAKARQFAF